MVRDLPRIDHRSRRVWTYDESVKPFTGTDIMNERDRQPELVGLVPPLWSRSVAELLGRHRGRWVALDGDRVVAVADTLPEVRASAREQGVDEPLLYRVPSHPERMAAYLVQRSGS